MPISLAHYVRNIWTAASTVFDGLVVTMANYLRKPTTIQYPDRVPVRVADTLAERYRGRIEVDVAICTACKLCETACPIGCIAIGVGKNAEGVRGMTEFAVDAGKCMYCGLCVEPCPTGAIRMTREFEGATETLDALVLRYVPEGAFVPPAKAKAALEASTPPRGELARQALQRAAAEVKAAKAVNE
jgi:formate hydrogenlyase subunit 6/NADH:ubiquinone oxidoreductase subunit I